MSGNEICNTNLYTLKKERKRERKTGRLHGTEKRIGDHRIGKRGREKKVVGIFRSSKSRYPTVFVWIVMIELE